MTKPIRRSTTPGLAPSFAVLIFVAICTATAGCDQAKPAATVGEKATGARDEGAQIAAATLGKDAEILARGDLAHNGREQLLVVNRISPGAPTAVERAATVSRTYIIRAAILEKDSNKWSEILLCDEHLKNPSGYLGGTPAGRVDSWRLEFHEDPQAGLELDFTPVERSVEKPVGESPAAADGNISESSGERRASFDVRWNKNTKRYQTYDKTQERFLAEVPSLETPVSTLK